MSRPKEWRIYWVNSRTHAKAIARQLRLAKINYLVRFEIRETKKEILLNDNRLDRR